MRRALTVAVLVLAAACGGDATLPRLGLQGAPDHGVLRVADPVGVSLLDGEQGRFTGWIRGGVRSRDWVFQSRLTIAGTQLAAISPLGEAAWHRDLDGDLTARLASPDGSRVALLPYGDAIVDPYQPEGRAATAITVVSTDSSDVREYVLEGNYEPEAFSTSGRSLFVIEYLPPMAPDRYRVRKLDLDTGVVGAVYSVDGHLQESMRGTARVASLSADGTRLYTLYTTDAGSHGDATAFVHVLDLDEEWAHCVDLPAPIGHSPEADLAIAADPNGDRALVLDALTGIAELDARALRADAAMTWSPPPLEPGPTSALVDESGRLHTARGRAVTVYDRDLTTRWAHAAPDTVVSLHDGGEDRVWAMGTRVAYQLDARTGVVERAASIPDDMPEIDLPAVPSGAPIQCAC